MNSAQRILVYIHRRDVRLSDNPVYTAISDMFNQENAAPDQSPVRARKDSATSNNSGNSRFTHLLPIYVFPANQVEVSGFLKDSAKSPYPEARSMVANVWRCGPHRAKFMAEGAWDLKESLEKLNSGSGLVVRVGMIKDVVDHILSWYAGEPTGDGRQQRGDVAAVWMTDEEGTEEKEDEAAVRRLADKHGVDFKLWNNEKYYIDDNDLPFDNISELPDAYTTFRKSLEPLRECPRKLGKTPTELPPLPTEIPPQQSPFEIPATLDDLVECLHKPLLADPCLATLPKQPEDLKDIDAHPFRGGETAGKKHLAHLISSGIMSTYNETRNGMLGPDFSTKLSGYFAQGFLTARQVHWAMFDFEEGKGEGKGVQGYGKGENKGTAAVRFELLWRDYFRLVQRKYRSTMFRISGRLSAKEASNIEWNYLDTKDPNLEKTQQAWERFKSGHTGMGLVDASNRELFFTGYTSNRARQNVASFLAKHLKIDWRVGSEWYEYLLTDYDVCSNWGNWQYVAGVGNDPRQNRVFNPVKQANDYDKRGEYIKAWIPELRGVRVMKGEGSGEVDPYRLMGVYQAWRLDKGDRERLGLRGVDWVERPLLRIDFQVTKQRRPGQGQGRRGGIGGSGHWRGNKGHSRDFRRMGQQEKADHLAAAS